MLIRRTTSPHSCPRDAFASLWALFTLLVMLAVLALAINVAWLSTGSQQLRSAADAAGLATSGELITDEWLRHNNPNAQAVLDRAFEQGVAIAAANRALGQKVRLELVATDNPDIVLGRLDSSGNFQPASLNSPSSLTLDDVDVVRIAARRLNTRGNSVPILLGPLVGLPRMDFQAVVLCRLDRDIIGFRATQTQSIPLVPFGIRSDPTGADPASWEHQIVNHGGPDDFQFDSTAGISGGPDGIHEIDVNLELAPMGNPANSSGYTLTIGTGTSDQQFANGVSTDDLFATDGKLVLDANNQLSLQGSSLGPTMGSPAYNSLRNNLDSLRDQQQVRIWPLVSSFAQGSSTATVIGFVAARVVRIEEPMNGPLRVRLQPAMRSVPLAITDRSRRGAAHLLPNPYLARTRVVR